MHGPSINTSLPIEEFSPITGMAAFSTSLLIKYLLRLIGVKRGIHLVISYPEDILPD